MEEDIKILEERIEFWRNDPRIMIQEDNFKILKAIENLLARYKQLEQENNNYKAAALKNDDLYKEVCNKNKELEEDYTSVYLKGVYDEREKWQSKIRKVMYKIGMKTEELFNSTYFPMSIKIFNDNREKYETVLKGRAIAQETLKELQELLRRRGEIRCVSIATNK